MKKHWGKILALLMVIAFASGLAWYTSREPLIGVWSNETVTVEFLAPNSVLWMEQFTYEFYSERDNEYKTYQDGDTRVTEVSVREGAVKQKEIQERGKYGVFRHDGDALTMAWVGDSQGASAKPTVYQARISANGDLVLKDEKGEIVLKPRKGKIFPLSLVGVWASGGGGRAIGASGNMARLTPDGEPSVSKIETLGDKLTVDSREKSFTLDGGTLTLDGKEKYQKVSSPFELDKDGTLSLEDLGGKKPE